MKNALVVIDIQNYFVNEKTQNLPKKIANYIRRTKLDYVLFTQFINKKNSNFFKLLNWKKCQDSPDIDIHIDLSEFVNKDNLFSKNSYSIFKSEALVEFLKKNKIDKLYLCGINTAACVLASAYEAFDLGYDVKVLTNLCASHYGNSFHEAATVIIEKNLQ